MQPQRVDDAHTELIFRIGSNETRMKPRVGAEVRPRVHRRCQFPTDSASFGKGDLSSETIQISWHSEAGLSAGFVTPPCGIHDHADPFLSVVTGQPAVVGPHHAPQRVLIVTLPSEG